MFLERKKKEIKEWNKWWREKRHNYKEIQKKEIEEENWIDREGNKKAEN